jgi:hypothetical protein
LSIRNFCHLRALFAVAPASLTPRKLVYLPRSYCRLRGGKNWEVVDGLYWGNVRCTPYGNQSDNYKWALGKHTNTYTQTHTHKYTHMHINTHKYTYTQTQTQTKTHTQTHTHTHKHTHPHTPTKTHTRARAHTHTNTHIDTHKHTHIHKHTNIHIHKHTHIHLHTQTQTQTQTHTHTHTNTDITLRDHTFFLYLSEKGSASNTNTKKDRKNFSFSKFLIFFTISSCHCTCKENFLSTEIPHFVFQPNSWKDLEFYTLTSLLIFSVIFLHLFFLCFSSRFYYSSPNCSLSLPRHYIDCILASIISFASIQSPELVTDSTHCFEQYKKNYIWSH